MNNPSRRHFLEGAAATIAGAAVLSSGTAEAAAKKGSKGTASYDLIIGYMKKCRQNLSVLTVHCCMV